MLLLEMDIFKKHTPEEAAWVKSGIEKNNRSENADTGWIVNETAGGSTIHLAKTVRQ